MFSRVILQKLVTGVKGRFLSTPSSCFVLRFSRHQCLLASHDKRWFKRGGRRLISGRLAAARAGSVGASASSTDPSPAHHSSKNQRSFDDDGIFFSFLFLVNTVSGWTNEKIGSKNLNTTNCVFFFYSSSQCSNPVASCWDCFI